MAIPQRWSPFRTVYSEPGEIAGNCAVGSADGAEVAEIVGDGLGIGLAVGWVVSATCSLGFSGIFKI